MYLNVTGFMLNLIQIFSSGQLFNYSAVMLFSRDTLIDLQGVKSPITVFYCRFMEAFLIL